MIHFCSIFLYKGFDGSDIISLVILAVLICISAFASGSETALFSLSPGDIRTVKNRGNKSDEAILKLLSTEDYTLATILILNNLVNIIIVILSNNIIDSLVTFTSAGWNFAFKTVLVTFILLLFGEIIPKVTASHPSVSPVSSPSRCSGSGRPSSRCRGYSSNWANGSTDGPRKAIRTSRWTNCRTPSK